MDRKISGKTGGKMNWMVDKKSSRMINGKTKRKILLMRE